MRYIHFFILASIVIFSGCQIVQEPSTEQEVVLGTYGTQGLRVPEHYTEDQRTFMHFKRCTEESDCVLTDYPFEPCHRESVNGDYMNTAENKKRYRDLFLSEEEMWGDNTAQHCKPDLTHGPFCNNQGLCDALSRQPRFYDEE